jgi:hypothetical protein
LGDAFRAFYETYADNDEFGTAADQFDVVWACLLLHPYHLVVLYRLDALFAKEYAFYHLSRENTNSHWRCTCVAHQEQGMCKHSISYSVASGVLEYTQRTSLDAIGLKPRLGRPPLPPTVASGSGAALSPRLDGKRKATRASQLGGSKKKRRSKNAPAPGCWVFFSNFFSYSYQSFTAAPQFDGGGDLLSNVAGWPNTSSQKMRRAPTPLTLFYENGGVFILCRTLKDES